MRLCLNRNQIWTTGIRAPRSTTHIGFRSPPAFLPLSGGGGVRNRGHTSSTTTIRALGSTTRKVIPDPPCLSTFKRRGGDPESGTHLSDGCDWSARISDAHCIPEPSAFLRLTNVGLFPVVSSFVPSFPLPSVLLLTVR
jgi:hypothetical protein